MSVCPWVKSQCWTMEAVTHGDGKKTDEWGRPEAQIKLPWDPDQESSSLWRGHTIPSVGSGWAV